MQVLQTSFDYVRRCESHTTHQIIVGVVRCAM
jgi:hypothetical protein